VSGMIFAGVTCDVCGKRETWHHTGAEMIKKWAREEGWSIGATHKCPDCRKPRKKGATRRD